jgi:hypothetical protein
MKQCPECDTLFQPDLTDLSDRDIIECPSCSAALEIVFLDDGGYCLESLADLMAADSQDDMPDDPEYPEPLEWLA